MQTDPIHLPLPKGALPNGSDRPYTSPEQAAEGRSCVQMNFPTRVLLSDIPGPHQVILFPAGVNPVPVEISDHWYLKAHGVTVYEGPEAA
jgi:hypothetical protein